MTETHGTNVLLVAVSLALAACSLAQAYEIDWHTIDGGGAGPANGGSYTLTGTIGQADARNHPTPMSGGSYALTGGFWVVPECPVIPADYDGDCDVDQADYALFESCASGPGYAYAGDCENRDFDSDGDVDQSDFAVIQRCYSGSGNPADPSCLPGGGAGWPATVITGSDLALPTSAVFVETGS